MIHKKAASVFTVVLYVAAGLFLAYAVWSFAFCADIISQARAAGQLDSSGNEYDIASFYMGNCGSYLAFSLLMATAGLLLHIRLPVQENAEVVQVDKNKPADEDIDDWFDETEADSDSDEDENT